MIWEEAEGYLDLELNYLFQIINVLDSEIGKITSWVEKQPQAIDFGAIDSLEYLSGVGFATAQQYIASICGNLRVSKKNALKLGPQHSGGETFASILNAASNYWKHSSEWDSSNLTNQQKETQRVLNTVINDKEEYRSDILLFELVEPYELRFKRLTPILEAWRDEVLASTQQ